MSSISCRAIRAEDVDAVSDVAREAWHATYATIFDTAFIDSSSVRTTHRMG